MVERGVSNHLGLLDPGQIVFDDMNARHQNTEFKTDLAALIATVLISDAGSPSEVNGY